MYNARMKTAPSGFVPASLALALVAAASILACGGSSQPAGKYPAQPEGCAVQVFPETPPMQTDNIGPVSASCDESVSDADCLRTLQDQACKLGADVVWGVDPTPTMELGKKKLSGRAAHTVDATAK